MTGPSGIQVFLVAPALMLWGLDRLLRSAGPDITVMETRLSLDDAITRIENSLPDVLVLDADDVSRIDSVRYAYERTRVKMVALVSGNRPGLAGHLQEAGVRVALEKRSSPSSLLRSILEVSAGAAIFDQFQGHAPPKPDRGLETNGSCARRSLVQSLTPRELQTIAAVTADASSPVKVIADRLHISEHTLRNHLTTIYSKLGVTGRLQLHEFAAWHHLAGPEPPPQVGRSLPLW